MQTLLLRPDEAAAALGISRSKLYALLADGSLPWVRVGRSLRVPCEGLAAWIRDHTAPTTGASRARAVGGEG